MKRLILLAALACPACTVFGGLTEEDQKRLDLFLDGSKRYFESKDFEKAAAQAEKGLELEPDNYTLKGRLAWSYLSLSLREPSRAEAYLIAAEREFEDVIDWRSIEDHDPKNVFGYAITLHNRARVEGSLAERIRREAKRPSADQSTLGKAQEHELRENAFDAKSKKYFIDVVSHEFTLKANKREAYMYLMALEYRAGHIDKALEYGDKSLELNGEHREYWNKKYAATQHVEAERIYRNEIARLESDEIKVRSRMTAYLREQKRWREAIKHLDVILEKRPNRFEDYYLRGACYRALNEDKLARADFQKFLQLGSLPAEHQAVKDANRFLYGSRR